ncbi:unnamed protein product [Rhizoctonia solani]|uniref:Uncharacterized protein n=1 Tax=Rhizoctonia solani TaxID=456999 RepID=A0A8H3HHE7_9AGAM|nr:unnamed protein product [Rhizoctonia solani]
MKSVGSTIKRGWHNFCQWINRPHIRRRLMIAAAVAAGIAVLVPLTIATAGFGPAGIVAGSAAAAWQSAAYGGFVASGSTLATLQWLGMTAGAIQLGIGAGGLAALGVMAVDST